MHKQIPPIFLFLFFVISCSDSSDSQGNDQITPKDYETYIIDSLSIPYLAELQILDYDESTQQLLLEDRQERAIIIIDQKGEIVEKFFPYVQGPGYVGDYVHGWIFSGSDELLCHSNYYFYRLKRNGEYIQKIKYPVEVKGIWSLDYSPEMLFSSTYANRDYLIAFITEPLGPSYNTQEFQDSINMVYKIELSPRRPGSKLQTEYIPEVIPIMQKQPNSVYKNLDAYVDRGWPYIEQINSEMAVVSYSIDTALYLFDITKNELLREIAIPKEFHPVYETVPFGSKVSPDRFRINTTVLTDGTHLVLKVLNIMPESVRRQIRARGGKWWESEAYKEASKKYFDSNMLLFDLEGNYMGQVTKGVGSLSYDFQSTSDGYYWANRRYEDERDYRTFLKIGIRPVSSPE